MKGACIVKMDAVELWYDKEYNEWERLERHKIEFEITKRYMDQYIQQKNQKIFDIGGGPGRYSFYLTERGHRVSLLDLSRHNIHVAREKSRELDIWLEEYIKGNALDLGSHAEESYDVILLMGPLYHLTEAKDRQKAMEEALRLLKKGGIIIVSFISNYAPIQDAFTWMEMNGEDRDVEELLQYLSKGENDIKKGFTTSYFSSAEEARNLMKENGLTELAFAGTENILGCKEMEIMKLPIEEQEKWLDLGFALSRDEKLFGTSQHYLYIGKK
ncbi:MAG: class I SAM-dependent methyltransferase [Acetivibrio sp.]